MREVTLARLAGGAPAIAGRVSRDFDQAIRGALPPAKMPLRIEDRVAAKITSTCLGCRIPSGAVPQTSSARSGRSPTSIPSRWPSCNATADVGAACTRGALRGRSGADDYRRGVQDRKSTRLKYSQLGI